MLCHHIAQVVVVDVQEASKDFNFPDLCHLAALKQSRKVIRHAYNNLARSTVLFSSASQKFYSQTDCTPVSVPRAVCSYSRRNSLKQGGVTR